MTMPQALMVAVEFYESNWDLVGQDFMEAISYFFTNSFVHYSLNSTAISLIPKVDVLI